MERSLFMNKMSKNFVHKFSFEFCGISQTEPQHTYGPGIRNMYIIHFILKGKGSYVVNNTVHFLKAGDLFIIRPNETVYYISDTQEPWSYGWFAFNGEDTPKLLEHTRFANRHYSFASRYCENYLHIIKECLEIETDLLEDELRVTESLYKLFRLLLTDGGNVVSSTKKKMDRLSEQTIDYIERHQEKRVHVEEIATFLAVDRSHLSRIFKKDMGTSVKEWLLSIEMSRASHLLSTTDETIHSIASTIGYRSTPSFIKAFTKYNGESPARYRKLHRTTLVEEIKDYDLEEMLSNLALIRKAT